MRGKCDTCEFFNRRGMTLPTLYHGTCHIRSVAGDGWPARSSTDHCGEHQEAVDTSSMDFHERYELENPRCHTCRFGRENGCHRHGPIDHFRWPATGGQTDDWCGDYERKPEPKPVDPPEDLPEVHSGERVEKSMERVEEPS